MLNIVGERERPNLGFASDFRCITWRQRTACFPFMKQERYTCRLYMRTVYCQNGEQVSVSRGPLGSCHAAVSARAILAYFQVAPSNHEDWEEVHTALVSHRRLQRMPSNRGEFSLARSIRAFREAACVKTKKRVTKPRMRTYTTYERRTMARSRKPSANCVCAILLGWASGLPLVARGESDTD